LGLRFEAKVCWTGCFGVNPRFAQYLEAAERLAEHAWVNHEKSLLAFAIRWILDRGETMTALWGARNADQLDAAQEAIGWKLSGEDYAEVERILCASIKNPVGPEFMAPPLREPVVPAQT
jgi:aryl-alcohol dehydrogenase-like predicted oxidoreductase